MTTSLLHCPALLPSACLAAGLALLGGCGDKDDGGDSGAAGGDELEGGGTDGTDGVDDEEPADCGSTAPVIESVTIENGGMAETPDGMAPSVLVTVVATDADGDLHELIADVYADQTIDGSVESNGSPFEPSVLSTGEAACSVTELGLTLQLAFPEGRGFELGTPVELGVVLSDALGNASGLAVADGCLPTAEGEDGDCAD